MVLNKQLVKHYLEVFLSDDSSWTTVERYLFDGVTYSTQAQKNSLVTMLYQNYVEERELSTIQVIFRFDTANLRIFSSLNYDDGMEWFYGGGFYDSNSNPQNLRWRLSHSEGTALEQVVWSRSNLYQHSLVLNYNPSGENLSISLVLYSNYGSTYTPQALLQELYKQFSTGFCICSGVGVEYPTIRVPFRGSSEDQYIFKVSINEFDMSTGKIRDYNNDVDLEYNSNSHQANFSVGDDEIIKLI